ncbi:MAG: glycosyltransferase family 8 protein [Tannerellaceae bacterium]|jgi:lipopolysaccharide biosynthesis glycosyltransferase|nr:glycosyltransferase family 8 protein [Tannerellaceae bacterium]
MIHIACNIDAHFTTHCAVTLVSLFENNKTSDICVHIIAPDLPDTDQEILQDLAADYGNEVYFYFPPADLLSDFSIKKFGKRISMTTYYRCMLSVILPEQLEKVLYLDCDIVVLGDIMEFWETDLSECGAACIEDIGKDEDERYERLHYDKSYSYFNAGVLLINLSYWREHKVDRQCVHYFRTYPERILFNDQDLLNVVLYKDKVFVPLMWNMQDGFYRYGIEKKVPDWPMFRWLLLHPAILHYTNKKPWNYDSMHPLNSEYYNYLDMTPWKGKRPRLSFKSRLQWYAKIFPYMLGLRKPKYVNLSDSMPYRTKGRLI